jgi:sugar transferase (PEP-CTERM/EpsH1 system associated)
MEVIPLRVAHLIETMHTGGAEAVVASLIDNLAPPFETVLICLKESGTSTSRIRRKDFEIVEMGKREGNDPCVPFRLANLMKQRGVSILHTHNWSVFCEGMIAAVLAGIPARVHTVHGGFRVYPPGLSYRFKERTRHAVESLLVRATGRIVAVSEDVRRLVCGTLHVDPDKIAVVNNGVDVPDNAPCAYRPVPETGRKPGERSIVSVSRLAEVKNVPMLLRAFSRVDVPFPIRLILVGDGPEREKLRKMANELGIGEKVTFLGNRSDVREILADSTVFALASTYEGVSIAILEAMAMGLPVVATKVGGNPGIVTDGETGFLVDPHDPEAMAEKISLLLMDEKLRARMGGKGRTVVEGKYSTARMARDYEMIYLDLLRSAKSN